MQSFKTILFAVAPPLLAVALCIAWLCSYLVEVRAGRTIGDAYCSATLSRGDVVLFTVSHLSRFGTLQYPAESVAHFRQPNGLYRKDV